MNNKKLVITMVVTISVLLLSAITIGILSMAGIDLLKIGKLRNNTEETPLAEFNLAELEESNKTIEEQLLSKKAEEIQKLDLTDTNINPMLINAIESSRSMNIDRSLYVDMEEKTVQNDYEEVKTYIPVSEIKISFDMDVSKTCGVSREDFITLVQNMKRDRTGILEANAGVIWDCCQKYSVNEIFVLGICGIESAWCSAPQHQRTHNYASLMSKGGLIPYASDAEGFEAMIKLLGQNYLIPGRGVYHGKTITGVGTSYCNTTTWPPKVYKCMQQVFE